MPHKRAKKSVRDATTASIGYNNPPSAEDSLHTASTSQAGSSSGKPDPFGGLSKNVYRILNAEKIREERKQRLLNKDKEAAQGGAGDRKGKRKATDTSAGGQSEQSKKLKIMPGENLKTFNNRVETTLRADINAAIRTSKSARKKAKLERAAEARKAAQEENPLYVPPARKGGKERATEFAGNEKVKLNDIVMAPPSLNFGKKATQKVEQQKQRLKEQPTSLKQKAELEVERENAIANYRALKAKQLASTQKSSLG